MNYGKSWRKLKDGSWGVGLDHDEYQPGEIVDVPKKAGGTSRVKLAKRVAGGEGWSIWTIEADRPAKTPPPPERRAAPTAPMVRKQGQGEAQPLPSDPDAPF